MSTFNINNEVKVKLTEYGIEILRKRHQDFLVDFPQFGEFKTPYVDEKGYSYFQFWELMQVFGNYMNEKNIDIPFEEDIVMPIENQMFMYNINSGVNVYLTQSGIEFLSQEYKEPLIPPLPSYVAITFTLKQLMQVFGKCMFVGAHSPFETDIIVPDSFLNKMTSSVSRHL